ncbi:MAG: multidrug transporter AcrB, partial [Rickettsiales bacterium]|nr:multidrug transporter AcrB [Rickettsiales bacterium]
MSDATGLTALSVRRPLLIIVVNLLILLAGLASLLAIDVRELPDVDRPVVNVRATYDGASPETMDAEVTGIIEGAIARVAGVRAIESSSEESSTRINVEFQPGIDINTAANDVREAVSQIERELPEDVDQIVVLKADDEAQPIVNLAAYSTSLTNYELAERIDKDIAPQFLSIPGVADVLLYGSQPRVLRVMLDPARLAGYRLSVSDVVETLRSVDLDVPAGSYESDAQDLLVRAQAS